MASRRKSKKTTQLAVVLRALSRSTVTAAVLTERHGITSPTARIADLRADGYRITSTIDTHRGPGGRVRQTTRYRLTSRRRGPNKHARRAGAR